MKGVKKSRNIIEWAMRYHQIVILVACCLIAAGIYSLSIMNKNEFPDFTVRQGVVVAVYPGATAEEIEEQVTKKLEDYIFTYKEVKKSKTQSFTQDGVAVIQIQLNDEIVDKDQFWNKFKHGISDFKSSLPKGVLAVQVKDDFGDTSALLVTIESKDKTYKELNDYADELKDRLRQIESVGRMNVFGDQKEQITVYVDNNKLAQYGIGYKTLAMNLFTKGFVTSAGNLKSIDYNAPIYVNRSFNSVKNVEDMIVYADPMGNNIRLKDVGIVKREYPEPTSYITNNGKKCLVLSIEMKKGQNIVKMGEEVKSVINKFKETIPEDVAIYTITDQSQVVDDSVTTFLKELLIAISAVILVVILLLPLKVALVAASTIPISIFISLGLFYAFGIELNTVTLAALIVTLGMIVDNSIVIIDCYLEKISEGISRWNASISSAKQFFKSIFSATLAISVTFFPFLFTTKGMIKDFLLSFPWSISIILLISLLVAELLVPFLQYYIIKKPIRAKEYGDSGKKKFSFLDFMQKIYDRILAYCFVHPYVIITGALISIVIGIIMISRVDQRIFPVADRNQFAVEIYMPSGTSLKKTTQVADSLENILRKDKRILSITSFKGTSSPRFQNSYAPQMGGSNFAQFIVNTTGNKDTEKLLDEYAPMYQNYFPEAFVKFKQLSYTEASSPIEVRLSGEKFPILYREAILIAERLRKIPELTLVRIDTKEPLAGYMINMNEDAASRLGISNAGIESTMLMRYSPGFSLGTIWEGKNDINIILKGNNADEATFDNINNEMIPANGGLSNVPLRQVAEVKPWWAIGQRDRRNGIPMVTVSAEIQRGGNELGATLIVKDVINSMKIPEAVNITYGGEIEQNEDKMPDIMAGLIVAIVVIFFILLAHFKRISTSLLIMFSLTLCIFGTAMGIYIQRIEFGVTCILGIISLMGILVRNSIIMFDYAEELRNVEGMSIYDAIYHSAKRRMRPIFLTSAAASMGVIPMILGGSGLWMPMGTVIFYGTLITMVFILTVMPIAYWKVMDRIINRKKKSILSK